MGCEVGEGERETLCLTLVFPPPLMHSESTARVQGGRSQRRDLVSLFLPERRGVGGRLGQLRLL